MFNRSQFAACVLLISSSLGSCQTMKDVEWPEPLSLGVDFQAYPTGTITSLQFETTLEGSHSTLSAHVGLNDTDRDDNGEHADESGDGPGFGFSGRHYWGTDYDGWFAGGRLDFWYLDIDWVDNPGAGNERRGLTEVVVMQPTALGGYRWLLGDSAWSLETYASLGAEINIDTCGEDVGEGFIGLIGFALSYLL